MIGGSVSVPDDVDAEVLHVGLLANKARMELEETSGIDAALGHLATICSSVKVARVTYSSNDAPRRCPYGIRARFRLSGDAEEHDW